MWQVFAWDKGTKKWHLIAEDLSLDEAKAATKFIALKGRVSKALHPNGQQLGAFPMTPRRPRFTFYYYRPLETK